MDQNTKDRVLTYLSQVDIAFACSVTPQTVNQWFSGRRPIPAKYCPVIERLSGVKAEQLRPDLDWVRTKTGLSVRF